MVLTLQERIFIVENVLRKGGKYTKEVQELLKKNLVQSVCRIEIVFPLCWISSKKQEVFKQTQNRPPKSRYRYSLTECHQQTAEEPTKVFEAFVSRN